MVSIHATSRICQNKTRTEQNSSTNPDWNSDKETPSRWSEKLTVEEWWTNSSPLLLLKVSSSQEEISWSNVCCTAATAKRPTPARRSDRPLNYVRKCWLFHFDEHQKLIDRHVVTRGFVKWASKIKAGGKENDAIVNAHTIRLPDVWWWVIRYLLYFQITKMYWDHS